MPVCLPGTGATSTTSRLSGALHAAVLRSPVAHARITPIDMSAARDLEGVHAVWTADDLGDVLRPSPMVVPHQVADPARTQYPLAREFVNYVGEPVAFVVADDRYVAEDACDLIEVEYDVAPGSGRSGGSGADGRRSSIRTSPATLPRTWSSRWATSRRRSPEPSACRGTSLHRAWRRPAHGVPCGDALFEPIEGVLTVYDTTQAPLSIRNGLAVLFDMPENQGPRRRP